MFNKFNVKICQIFVIVFFGTDFTPNILSLSNSYPKASINSNKEIEEAINPTTHPKNSRR